jgi:hypothetical protein
MQTQQGSFTKDKNVNSAKRLEIKDRKYLHTSIVLKVR